jgi:hypothetical protein
MEAALHSLSCITIYGRITIESTPDGGSSTFPIVYYHIWTHNHRVYSRWRQLYIPAACVFQPVESAMLTHVESAMLTPARMSACRRVVVVVVVVVV